MDEDGNPPIRYEAIRIGLRRIKEFAVMLDGGVHMPRTGCGLAGGTWDKIEPLVQEVLVENNISTTVYDF